VDNDRRVHLVGKGVLRFHAVYWPAMLLSAGEPPPTDILVHDYLTVDGAKISKSSGAGAGADPAALAARYGTDAVRWWLLREVPRVGDADFTVDRLTARADTDLANDLGNLVNRVVSMVHRYRDGRPPAAAVDPDTPVAAACREVPGRVAGALAAFDFRRATAAVWTVVEEANRHVEHAAPWLLARSERDGDRSAARALDTALATLLAACRTVADEFAPFLPATAARVATRCAPTPTGQLPPPRPLFPRLSPGGGRG
jgi:methionyl-tRNA synthetase